MITLTINDQKIEVEEGATILEAAKALGINIPTLCYHKALSPYGACRLCIVELVWGDHQSQVVASCLYPAQEGLVIKTHSERVLTARRIIAELLLARCPDLKELQDMAKELGVTRSRLRPKNEDCTLCGLCVRMCQERMGIGAVGFAGRGSKREIVPAFNMPSDICQTCGACASICPTGRIKLEEITKNRPRPILSKFDEGLISIKPINILYPQAVPNWAAIDKEACVHLLKDKCGICEVVCDARAIDYTEKEEKIDLQVGSIILSPGYDTFSASLKNEYGFGRYKNVVSSIQFERILSASGPFAGHIQRLSDGKEPKRIAWIQCVGSRDFQVENPYCSSVCCTYAVKQAIIAKEHSKEKLETTIFYMDIRTFGKGFEEYYNRARDEYGVNFVKGRVSRVFENGKDGNLLVRFADEGGRIKTDEFGLVVLSVGLTPNEEVKKLARHLGIKLNEFGFAKTDIFSPIETTRPGVFVCGAFTGPKDIPETVMQGSASASKAGGLIAGARGSLITKKEYPPEIDVSGQGPRIGVFVCHCGINIGGVIDVPSVVEYARTLPNVVYAEHNLYTCSEDTQKKIVQIIKEHNLNRVIVASCTPRTHEPLFRETCRDAGLNPYLFEMANIRDQCSWVHMKEPEAATRKAKDLVRIAVAKSRILEPLYGKTLKVNHAGLVVGGGISGMRAALDLASSGFQVHLVEKEGELGGNLRRVHYLLDSTNPKEILQDMITRVNQSDKIKVYLNASLSKIDGFFGNFETSLNLNGEELQIKHGAVIIATGAQDYKPTEYLYGQDGRVLTQLELEERLAEVRNQKTEVRNQKTEVRNQKTEVRNQKTEDRGQRSENENLLNLSSDICHLSSVVMIQCVGSREEGRPYCSRLCCQHAIKNALRIKDISPQTNIYILYRDIRSYGFKELFYEEARRKGIIFIRYNEDEKPVVRNQKTEDRGQKTEDRGQKTEDRGQKTEDRGQKTEDRGQKTEDRGQKTEDRGQKTEDRGQKTEDGSLLNLSSDICHLTSVLEVEVSDSIVQRRLVINPDLVVLSAAVVPNPTNKELAQLLKVPLDQNGFFLEAHIKLRPIDFASEGVYMAGLAHSPKDISESISQASGAAGRAATILSKDELELEATLSFVVDANCDGCAYCIDPCPYKAITLIEYMKDGAIKKTVESDESKCKGCGVCMATCPKKGIYVKHFKPEMLSAMVEAALQPVC